MRIPVSLLFAASMALGTPCLAQTPAGRLAEQARAQIEELNEDSAVVLLTAALQLQGTRPNEKLRAFTLLALARLGQGNQRAAIQAFEQALRIDLTMRIDSLDQLYPDVQVVFAQARRSVEAAREADRLAEAARRLELTVVVPADTVLFFDDPRLLIAIQPNARAQVVSSIATADLPNRPIWEDTQVTLARQTLTWKLRGPPPDGVVMAAGRYLLKLQATDSTGQATPVVERVLRVARAPVDTQPHPPVLADSAFAPETLQAGTVKPRGLVWGGSFAAMIAAMPLVLGNSSLNAGLAADPTAYGVAGGVAVASVVGFVRGRRPRLAAENIQRNQQVRDNDRRQREAIARANADARARAPIRVTVERSP